MLPPPPIVAFGFANLAMLGWVAAAAAPILIHLWMRQTHRETAWAAIRFLRAALERQARRLRLQHWILLAIRTAILLLVALAAAKPFLDGGPLSGGAPTHRLLVIDASLSMNALAGGATRLGEAKRLAAQLVGQSRAGDSYSLLVMGAAPGVPISRPIADAEAVRRAIEAVEPTYGVADLGGALAAAKRTIDTHSDPARPKRREVVFFSDLEANTWRPLVERDAERGADGGERSDEDPTAKLYEQLAEGASLSVVDVGNPGAVSAAVTLVELADALATMADPIEVRAEAVLNDPADGADDATERIAELLVDGLVVAEQRVTLRRDRSTAIDFVHRFAEPGVRSIGVRLAGGEAAESLPQDDTRWLAMRLRSRVRVLCVAGARGAASYLSDALNPAATREAAFEPVVVSDADLSTVDLGDFDCVFFSNVTELSEREAARIERYVAGGGGVVFFLGDRVDPHRYNEVLGPAESATTLGASPRVTPFRTVSATLGEPDASTEEPSILPVTLGPPVSRPSYRIDPLDYAHPIVAPFRGRERAGLLTTPVARYFPMTISTAASSDAAVALALGNGDPLLVTSGYGRGRCAVVATAASLGSIDPASGEPWTAMPAWPSFLPIVRELVRYVTAAGEAGAGVQIGEPLLGSTTAGQGGATRIARPDGETTTLSVDSEGRWAFGGADTPGVYRYGTEGVDPIGAIAVNVDPREGALRRVAADRLPASLRVRQAASSQRTADTSLDTPTPLHRWLLYAVLLLVLTESALACWFGRGSV